MYFSDSSISLKNSCRQIIYSPVSYTSSRPRLRPCKFYENNDKAKKSGSSHRSCFRSSKCKLRSE